MIDDDGLPGKGAGEIQQVGKLRKEVPGIEGEPELAEFGEAFAERRIEQAVAGDRPRDMLARLAFVPRRAVAHAAEAAAGHGDLGLQHRAYAAAQHQVGPADDRLAGACLAVLAGGAHGGDAVHELDLAHGLHLVRPGGAEHRLAFEEHRRDDVVAAADILQQLGQEVAAAIAVRGVPQVVVRIDDRQVGLQRRLGGPLGQPGREIGTVPMDQSAIFTVGHLFLLSWGQAYGRMTERDHPGRRKPPSFKKAGDYWLAEPVMAGEHEGREMSAVIYAGQVVMRRA